MLVPWRRLVRRLSSDARVNVYDPQYRRQVADELLNEEALQGIEDSSVADVLLEQTRKVVEMQQAAIQALENKAIAQIGIAGTIVGVFAAFGRHFDSQLWSLISISPLIAAVLCSGIGIYIRRDVLPAPAIYNLKRVYSHAANKAKIVVKLVEIWKRYSIDLTVSNRRKALWIKAGSVFLLLGLTSLAFATMMHSIPGSAIPK